MKYLFGQMSRKLLLATLLLGVLHCCVDSSKANQTNECPFDQEIKLDQAIKHYLKPFVWTL